MNRLKLILTSTLFYFIFSAYLLPSYAYEQGTIGYTEEGVYLDMMNITPNALKGDFRSSGASNETVVWGNQECKTDPANVAPYYISATIENNTVGPNGLVKFDVFKISIAHNPNCEANPNNLIVLKGPLTQTTVGNLPDFSGKLQVVGSESTGIYQGASGSVTLTVKATLRFNGSALWAFFGYFPKLTGSIKPYQPQPLPTQQ